MVRPSHAVSVAGIVAVIALGAGGLAISRTANGSGVPGIPHVVASRLGAAPLVLTLHQSVLALLSPPGVDRLAALEAAIARRPDVRGEYGPVSWLRSQLSLIASTIAARTSSRVTRADLLVRYGATGGLSIDNQGLASTLVFGSGIQPLRELRWLFPSDGEARIFVRAAGARSRPAIAGELTRLVERYLAAG